MSRRRKRTSRQLRTQPDHQPPQSQPVSVQRATYYEGPLPPPELLIKYNEAHPDAAEIILHSFKEEGAHRRRMEAALVGKGIVRSFRGQVFGFIVAMVALLGGVGLLLLDKDTQGYSTIGAGFVALVGAFTVGRIVQVRGLREQAEDFSRSRRADTA